METKVYMERIPTEAEKTAMKYSIDNNDFKQLSKIVSFATIKIEIGSRDTGWKFMLKSNPTFYKNDKENVDIFLRYSEEENPLWRLINSEGKELTVDEFWRDYVYSNKDGLTYKEYYKEHPDKYAPYLKEMVDSEKVYENLYRYSNYKW